MDVWVIVYVSVIIGSLSVHGFKYLACKQLSNAVSATHTNVVGPAKIITNKFRFMCGIFLSFQSPPWFL